MGLDGVSLFRVLSGQHRGVGWAACLAGGSGEGPASRPIQAVAEFGFWRLQDCSPCSLAGCLLGTLFAAPGGHTHSFSCGLFHLQTSDSESGPSCASKPSDFSICHQQRKLCL